MSNVRYVLDIIDGTTEDIDWLSRSLKNIAALLNAKKVTGYSTNAMLVIAPLKEEDKDEYKNQNN